MHRFKELGDVLKVTGGKAVPATQRCRPHMTPLLAAVDAGVTRGKAHSHALGKVQESYTISARQLRRGSAPRLSIAPHNVLSRVRFLS